MTAFLESAGWMLAALLAWWMGVAGAGVRRELVRLEDAEPAGSDYGTIAQLRRLGDDATGLALRLRFSRLLCVILVPLAAVMAARGAGLGVSAAAGFLGWLAASAADATGGSPLGRMLVRFPAGRGLPAWSRATWPAARFLPPLARLRTREDPGAPPATLAPAGVPLGREERRLLRKLLASTAILVSDIMTRWGAVRTLDADTPGAAVAGVLRASGRSRLPVVSGTRVLGVISVKDLLRRRHEVSGGPLEIRDVMRPVYFVKRETRVQDLLDELREASEHFAVVVDTLGRAVGIVTVEDVLEEIVGELYDEREAPQ